MGKTKYIFVFVGEVINRTIKLFNNRKTLVYEEIICLYGYLLSALPVKLFWKSGNVVFALHECYQKALKWIRISI